MFDPSVGTVRRLSDAYPTPLPLVEAAIDALPDTHPARILDLGAGDGRWGMIARQRWPVATITGIELRPVDPHPDYDIWHTGDLLTSPQCAADLVIGNPPYNAALTFVRRALDLLTPDGMAALLLQLSFLEPTSDQAPLLAARPPARMLVAQRARFNPESRGTDSATVALMIWTDRTPCGPPIAPLIWKERY